ncbi:glycoside hydrolase family 16 protein [Glonium stellatum]|uniref:endo-1,3(4)-beta-glucanase n=1 Tax=Glonium stellatum TaxID=574774 RepID=A0A8E2JM35_9PEZI|nr:glycoside hydrolase family 16 protein [Glonium stellatum]
MKSSSSTNPRNWSKKVWLGIAAAVIIIAIIVGAVVGVRESERRANAYPDYSKLNYSLLDTYAGTGFFDNFDYFTGYDPSSGFVHYVDAQGSQILNLTYATSSTAILRVDTTDTNATTGRKSVRITSKKLYSKGLFVFDIVNTPYGCSTWPALWLTDPSNWPTHGEIDVVEAVNGATTGNQMTLHTTKGCEMDRKRKETGKVLTKDCYNGTDSNAGCGVQGSQDTYGQALNANGGGVYAMEWRSEGIRMWFFPRSNIPSDITEGASPDPSTWGTALADFPSTDCNIGSHFQNQSIIANIDLCGSWAGSSAVYSTGCPGLCTDFVANNATAFETAFWQWNSWKVYLPV